MRSANVCVHKGRFWGKRSASTSLPVCIQDDRSGRVTYVADIQPQVPICVWDVLPVAQSPTIDRLCLNFQWTWGYVGPLWSRGSQQLIDLDIGSKLFGTQGFCLTPTLSVEGGWCHVVGWDVGKWNVGMTQDAMDRWLTCPFGQARAAQTGK